MCEKIKKGLSIFIGVAFLLLVAAGAGLAFDEPPGFNPDFNFRVLLEGTGWYAGVPEGMANPSQTILQALDGEIIEGARVKAKLDWDSWPNMIPDIIAACEEFDPDIVVSVGQAGSAPGIRLEKYGCNTSYGTDNDGIKRGSKDKDGNRIYEPIDPNGPDWYEADFPLEEAVAACLAKDIPAYIGDKYHKEGYGDTWFSTAGSFTCNWTAYGVPHGAKKAGLDFKFVFLHVPTVPAYRALWMSQGRKPGPSMEMERMIEGVRTIIAAAVIAQTGHKLWDTDDRHLLP